MSLDLDSLSDAELYNLIDRLDREAIKSGFEPKYRPLEIDRVLSGLTGKEWGSSQPTAQELRVRKVHESFFTHDDLKVGSLYEGLIFHTDLFFKGSMPTTFGVNRIYPINYIGMNDAQKKRLERNRAEILLIIGQWNDIADIAMTLYAHVGYEIPSGDVRSYFRMAAFHNAASATVLLSGHDRRGAVQSALLGAEFAIKCALLHLGKDKAWLKSKIGHDLSKAIPLLKGYEEEDYLFIRDSVKAFTHFVDSRYEDREWSRVEAGSIAIATQHLIGIVARKISGGAMERVLLREQGS